MLFLDGSLQLLLEHHADEFVNCSFPDTLNRFAAAVQKVQDGYVTNLFRLRENKVERVKTIFNCKISRPANRYVNISKDLVLILSALNKIEVYSINDEKLSLEEIIEVTFPISDFTVSDGNILIASDEAATFELFVPKQNEFVKSFSRVFKNVQEVKLLVKDPLVLVHAHRYTDQTGESYYGVEKLFSYKTKAGPLEEVTTYAGTIHDCQTSHSGKHFVVVSGKMPSHTILYENNKSPIRLITHDFRNYVRFSPDDKYLAVAGFGSLNGDIDVFDANTFEILGNTCSSHSSFLKWTTDSKFFVTATVAPKLRVDHKISVYSYNCVLFHRFKLDKFDLYHVEFLQGPVLQDQKSQPKKIIKKDGLLTAHLDKPGPINESAIKIQNGGDKPAKKKTPTLEVGSGNSKEEPTMKLSRKK